MKKFNRFKISGLLANILLATLFAFFCMPLVGVEIGAGIGAGIFAFGTLPQLVFPNWMPTNILPMAVQVEIWARDIAENLYPDNAFYMASVDDSAFLNGKKVHLPQAGAAPNVVVNRTVYPATAVQREDTDLDYTINEFTTDPTHLTATEEVEVSYNKRMSILYNHMQTLRTRIAENFAHIWAPTVADNFVRTSGSARAAYKAGQTGNRKALTKKDITALSMILNSQDIDQEGRVLLIDAYMYNDLLNIDEFKTLERLGEAAIMKGAVGMVGGFNVFVRSSVVKYTNDSTPTLRPYASAVLAADNLAAMAWHPSCVRRALGSDQNGGIQVFEKNNDPQYYGDVFSALVRAGGKKARTDEKGVVALIEAAG